MSNDDDSDENPLVGAEPQKEVKREEHYGGNVYGCRQHAHENVTYQLALMDVMKGIEEYEYSRGVTHKVYRHLKTTEA